MNYLPDLNTVHLKDSWVFIEGEEIHLFFLAENPADSLKGRLFGHAVSTDWLHWETLEPVDPKGDGDAWDAGTPGTGYVFQYDDGRYYLAYTGWRDDGAGLVSFFPGRGFEHSGQSKQPSGIVRRHRPGKF